MSAKVANLIAVELGILIAILSGMAVASFRPSQPALAAREPAPTITASAPLARHPRRPAVNYRADDTAPEALADENATESASADDQSTATEPDGASYLDNGGYVTADEPYYDAAEPVPEPYFDSPDYYDTPAAPYVTYPQYYSSVVVFSSTSRRSNCHRSRMQMRPQGVPMPVRHRRPAAPAPRRVSQPPRRERGPGLAPRPNVQTQPAGPNSSLRSRDHR